VTLAHEPEHLATIGRGRTPAAPTKLVHHRIELQAAVAPEAIAVRFRDESLTYGELNRRANRLARHLVAAGIGPEGRVVVCVEPALDVVVALVAILKAGAVYVPLDLSHPAARVRALLDDTRPELVVTRSHLIEKLPRERGGDGDESGFATLALDTDGHLLAGLSDEDLGLPIASEQTAYVYYTSGTTGAPKGVMASYANLASYVHVAQTRYQFTNRDVIPAIARFTFSISMFELMLPLVSGGTLIVLERDHILDFVRMSRTLSEVTFFHAGPSLLKKLLPYIKRHYAEFSAFSRVRHASSGGDMVPGDVLEALRDVFFNAEVFVIYGCSEISCMGCTYPVPRDPFAVRGYGGRPFDDMILRVTDAALEPVPAGAEGEILFAGPGVVKGYLNRPDLTAEKFVEIDGLRFYRTGDMGRMGEDGCLELLGRSDFQIKLRGMRIELGEVEHHLRRAPGVLDGVVVARDAANGEKALVAYVVMDDAETGAGESDAGRRASAIRLYMAERLPDYMVPVTYVELAALPLNHNMKLDRHALPEPEGRRVAGVPGAREAETPTERRLASLWKKLLPIDEVGLDDNFFDLGGDSMLALALILEIDRDLGVVLEGMEVLRESLEVQAALCDRRLGKAAGVPRARAPKVAVARDASEAVEPFHFGRGHSLYGVLYGGRRPAGGEAALICSPVGHEGLRAQFVLQRLAKQLAAQGIPALRFDYYGLGDSLGETVEASCARWQQDIADACAELERRTNAARITAVGVRLGGTLLWHAAVGLDVAKVVLWDPICDGSGYYTEMTEGHRRYLGATRHLRFRRSRSRRGTGSEEILGSTYSETALRELKALAIAPIAPSRPVPVKWLGTSQHRRQEAIFRAICGERTGSRIEAMDVDCSWHDVSRLEDILPDIGISKKLAEMVTEKP
jgi:amino acid adenylation domain-containing protein